MAANYLTETVTSVHHWNEKLFSFRTTRDPGFRFRNGEFVMVGLDGDSRPVVRAYSIASPNYEEELEFLSIKVPDGQLTSRLQHISPGDSVLISRKPTGTLVLDDLRPGRRLFLLGTGTGLAPFMSIIKDFEVYERFEQVILFHGVRHRSELAYHDFITRELPYDEIFGEMVRDQLIYYPSVTREDFLHTGRVTELLQSGKMLADLDLPPLDPASDRIMLCGNPQMLADTRAILDEQGFSISPRRGEPGDYVIERAFVEK